MNKRTIDETQRNWLIGEIEFWKGEKILQEEQEKKILALYEDQSDISKRKTSTAVFALIGVATLLVGLAVILLIGFNWQAIPAAAKLIAIFAVIGITYAAGFILRHRFDKRLASEIVFFFGSLLYGAGIWLIGQIFQISGSFETGMLLWLLGVMPIALLLETPLLHVLYAGLLAIYATELIFTSDFFLSFGGGGDKTNWMKGISVLLLIAPALAWTYRRRSRTAIWLYIPMLAYWGALEIFWLQLGSCEIFFFGIFGALLLFLAELHEAASRFAIPYRFYGALLTVVTLFVLTFSYSYEYLHNSTNAGAASELGLKAAFAGLFLTLVSLTVGFSLLLRANQGNLSLRERLIKLLARQWLPFSIALYMVIALCISVLAKTDVTPMLTQVLIILANVLIIVTALWLLRVGLSEDRGSPFSAGVLLLLCWAVVRYADLFGREGGLLGAAGIFLLCGVTLFGVAFFWRRRNATNSQ